MGICLSLFCYNRICSTHLRIFYELCSYTFYRSFYSKLFLRKSQNCRYNRLRNRKTVFPNQSICLLWKDTRYKMSNSSCLRKKRVSKGRYILRRESRVYCGIESRSTSETVCLKDMQRRWLFRLLMVRFGSFCLLETIEKIAISRIRRYWYSCSTFEFELK